MRGNMPTYEYECNACGHKFDVFQNITEKPLRRCPECKRLKARRLIGRGAGIIFKGSGFYQTDYRSEGYNKRMKEEKGGTTAKPKEDQAKTGSPGPSGTKSGEKQAKAPVPGKD